MAPATPVSGNNKRLSNASAVNVMRSDNPLTSLIRRLEAATSRLEDIASSAESTDHVSPPVAARSADVPPSSDYLAPTVSSDATPTPKAMPAAPPHPPTITAMDELIDEHVENFVTASKGLNPLIEEQAASVAKAFADQRRFLLVTTKAKKPDLQSPQTFNDLLKDLQQHMGAVGDIRDSHRASPMKEHLAMVGEGIGALQWLLMDGKPADFVGEILGGAQMYGNRVLKAYKET